MYAMLSTLGPDGWETLRQKPDRIMQVRTEVEALGLTVHAQYALDGSIRLLEHPRGAGRPDDGEGRDHARRAGTMRTTTLPAIPVEDLINRLKE